MTYDEEKSIHNDTWPSDHVITWDLVTNEKLHIPSSTRPITTQYGRLVTHGERNPTMRSHDSLTTWSCVYTSQIKCVIYKIFKINDGQTLQDADMWKPKMKFHDSLITWSQEVMCQIENIASPLLLSYDHQTWQGGNLWWHKATHIASWPSDYAVVGCYVKNLKRNISYSASVMVPKLGRVKTEGERAPPMKPHDH